MSVDASDAKMSSRVTCFAVSASEFAEQLQAICRRFGVSGSARLGARSALSSTSIR